MKRFAGALIAVVMLAGLGRASTVAVLVNDQTALAPLNYYCAITNARLSYAHGRYTMQRGRKRITFQLFNRSLRVGHRRITVPIPPMKIFGIVCIPIRRFARYFGDTVSYKQGTEDAYKAITIGHRDQAYVLDVMQYVDYLDTSRVARQSCAFAVERTPTEENQLDDDFPDIYVARNGQIIWQDCCSSSPNLGNHPYPPQMITTHTGESFITFTGTREGGSSSLSVLYYVLRINGNTVRSVLPVDYLHLPIDHGEAGIILQKKSTGTQFIVYDAPPTKGVSLGPYYGSYTISWYRWEHDRFRLRGKSHSALVELHNPRVLRHLFAQIHISGEAIFNRKIWLSHVESE